MTLRRVARWLRRVLPAATAILSVQAFAEASIAPPAPLPAADCPAPAQPPTPETMALLQTQARDRGFLWRISKGGTTSYLYGTIHLARLEWVVPGPRVGAALRASQVLALEIDLSDPSHQQRLQAALPARADEPGATLPPDLERRLLARLQAECAPAALLQAMSPEMVSLTLTMMAARRDGLEPGYGIDTILAHAARAMRKPILSLETPEAQLQLMRARSPTDLRASLEKALDALEQGRARPLLLRLARIWADSALNELSGYSEWCDCLNTDAERIAMKTMLDDRNLAMADRIDALHADEGKSVFAAVGSLHFIGPAALQTEMASRGYRVERVPFNP